MFTALFTGSVAVFQTSKGYLKYRRAMPLEPPKETPAEAIEEVDERALVRGILAGNRDDFRQIVVVHQQKIFRLIARQVGRDDVAHDLAQEVFIRAYRSLGTFRFDSRLGTWLTRIALNVTANYFSSRAYRDERKQSALSPAMELASTNGHDAAHEELVRSLRAAVSDLKPKLREVIVLCAFEKKSYEEAAAVLGIPVGTVRSRLNSARNELRKMLFRKG